MNDAFSVAARWEGGLDEARLREWILPLRARLGARKPNLGLVFATPALFDRAAELLELIQVHGQTPLLAGCSSPSLIAGDREFEQAEGFVLGLYALPGAELKAVRFTQEEVEEANSAAYWRAETGVGPDDTNGWLCFADPFHLDCEHWLQGWNEAYAPLPVLGGLASGDYTERRTQIYLNGEVFEEGGVALSVGGDVALAGSISQGCTPIGETWTITKVEKNVIYQIGNRPAYQVLIETFSRLSPEEQRRTQQNVFVGLVINEYLEDFHRGDFLIRNLLGADERSGAIAVGALPRVGQTIQFQRRDAAASAEDMIHALTRAQQNLAGRPVYGACLCSCNGRGAHLFGKPDHDARRVQEQLGPLGLAGFFCNGEFGPVGDRNFLHGYTASLALFVPKSGAGEADELKP